MTDLETAVRLLTIIVDPGMCRFGSEKIGEACGRSAPYGGPCDFCRTNKLLKKLGYTGNKYQHWDNPVPSVKSHNDMSVPEQITATLDAYSSAITESYSHKQSRGALQNLVANLEIELKELKGLI